MYIYMKMDIKLIEWDRSNREEGQDYPRLFSAAEVLLSCTNSYSGKFGDAEVSMLWADGKGVTHLKKRVTGVAEDI